MARYIFQGSFKDLSGNAVSDGSVVVKKANSTGLAIIYPSSGASTAITTATVSSSDNGKFIYWIDDGDYTTSQKFKIELSKVNFKTNTYDDLVIFPPVSLTGTETLSNKTLTSPEMTNPNMTSPRIYNIAGTFKYITKASALTASRNVTLPLLTGNDEFTFNDHAQTLSNKTFEDTITGSSGLTVNHIYGTIGSSSATFTDPILTSPTIADFTNANHSHLNSSGGGVISGTVRQIVNFQTGAVATGVVKIPNDDTIPQSNEGDQYMSLAITPNSATNKLLIESIINISSCNSDTMLIASLIQDSSTNAIAASRGGRNASVYSETAILLRHYMTAGTTSATTFKIRAGANSTGTTTFNGTNTGRIFGGVMVSSITITETST